MNPTFFFFEGKWTMKENGISFLVENGYGHSGKVQLNNPISSAL
jgi:hypothetical protein